MIRFGTKKNRNNFVTHCIKIFFYFRNKNINMNNADNVNAREYFDFDENTKQSVCKVDGCKKHISGNHLGNLARHLQTVHNIACIKKSQGNKEKACKVSISLEPKELVKACVEIVTVNGRPLRALEDSGFRKIIDPILKSFAKNDIKLTINKQNIHDDIQSYNDLLKNKIKEDIKDKIISLKFDIASKHNKSILGINIQFIKDDQLKIVTIGMRELEKSHTSEYICTVLMETLEEFGISISQIYSITTDNGANMIKSIKLLNMIENFHELDDIDLENYEDLDDDEQD